LRWFGHVLRINDTGAKEMNVGGRIGRGSRKKVV